MLLSAALIVRDEAAVLGDCLASLRGLVDEIVVVDTGSVDDTVAIARAHDAVIDHYPWHADFAAARNHSLDLARGDWVLYIDADERVVDRDAAATRAALTDATERSDVLAWRVPFVPRVGWTPYLELRLWRHRADVRFRGALHETVLPALGEVAERERLRTGVLTGLTIEHLGYEGDQSHKRSRDEPMLAAAIAEQPTRSFLHDHLARVHEHAGEHDLAVASWKRGIAAARARGFDHPEDAAVFANLFGHCAVYGDDDADTPALLAEAEAAFPGIPSIELAVARWELADDRAAAAVTRLERLVAMDDAALLATGNSYDRRIVGEWAWDLLGRGRFALGDDAGAAAAFRQAEDLAPEVAEYRTRRLLAEARSSRGQAAS